MRLLLGEMLTDDPAGGGMPARIGDGVQPRPELGVQIIEGAERAAEEEILTHVAEGAFDLALGLSVCS
jgi:hypothetical protein